MSLAITYSHIRRELGRFLGLDRSTANWSADDVTDVEDIMVRGERRFYSPELAVVGDKAMVGHRWSFLQKELSITLTATTYHDLPADFVQMSERPSIDGSSFPLDEIRESELRDLINSGAGVGDPQYYTVKRLVSATPMGYKIGLYPTPTAGQVLSGWYQFQPEAISAVVAPIVPAVYAEAFLASILATADEMLNYETQSEGRHLERFKALLPAAILHDQGIGGGS